MTPRSCGVAFLLSLCGCWLGGCSDQRATGNDAQSRTALRILGVQYGQYLGAHNGAPPADEAAMRTFLESQMGDLSGYGVKTVDDLLKAGRDGQSVRVICGKTVVAPDQPEYPWAAYEQTGVDGKRLACNVRGRVFELGPEEFAQQLPGE